LVKIRIFQDIFKTKTYPQTQVASQKKPSQKLVQSVVYSVSLANLITQQKVLNFLKMFSQTECLNMPNWFIKKAWKE